METYVDSRDEFCIDAFAVDEGSQSVEFGPERAAWRPLRRRVVEKVENSLADDIGPSPTGCFSSRPVAVSSASMASWMAGET